MINSLELLTQYRNAEAQRQNQRTLADLAQQKFALEQQMAPGQLEAQRLSNLGKQMQIQNYPAEFAMQQAKNQAVMDIQRQGLARQAALDKANQNYRNEQLRLKRLELDPFGMLGTNGQAPTQQSQANPSGMQGQDKGGITGAGIGKSEVPALEGTGKTPNISALQNLPQPIVDQVKALADGRMAFPSGFALKSPYWQKMISLVSAYDPSFDAVNYNARAKTRSDMTSGVGARNLTAINTAIGHLDSLDKAATALNNGDYPLLNFSLNKIIPAIGGTETAGKLRTFQQSKEAVANELMRVFRGTGASTADTKQWADTINSSDSPAALKASVRSAVDLLKSRIQALNDQYTRGMGKSTDVTDFINPKAKATLQRLSGESGGEEKIAPSAASNSAPKSFSSLPDPAQFDGKTMTDTTTNTKYISKGGKWLRVGS